ncbi:MAG: hypothetical protein RIE53_13210 [Rhodothermales bacterium]
MKCSPRSHALIAVLLCSTVTVVAQPASVYRSYTLPANEAGAYTQTLSENGWEIVGTWDAASPEGCTSVATVFAGVHADASTDLSALNAETAPFGMVDRWALIRDEEGAHVVVVNPVSIWRTVLLDHPSAVSSAEQHAARLFAPLASGNAESRGQERSRGHIGKTMGVMAGGLFDERIGLLHHADGMSLETALDRIRTSFGDGAMTWGLDVKYVYHPDGASWAVVGVSGAPMESKSFEIVGAGNRDQASGLACPGIDHAAAYPIELVVRSSGDGVDILAVDAMYRMKMFFEDAGKWAFMKNMTMPGSIADEIKTRLAASLWR